MQIIILSVLLIATVVGLAHAGVQLYREYRYGGEPR